MKNRTLSKIRSYSLIELLVVIVIIIILMGLLFGALQTVYARQQAAQVTSLISRIEIGMNKYKEMHGDYPPQSEASYFFKGDDLKALTTTDKGGPFCELEEDYINQDGELIDVWGNRIYYIPAVKYPSTPLALKKAGDVYYRFTEFQLRSLGKNGAEDGGRKDDLQNFQMLQ